MQNNNNAMNSSEGKKEEILKQISTFLIVEERNRDNMSVGGSFSYGLKADEVTSHHIFKDMIREELKKFDDDKIEELLSKISNEKLFGENFENAIGFDIHIIKIRANRLIIEDKYKQEEEVKNLRETMNDADEQQQKDTRGAIALKYITSDLIDHIEIPEGADLESLQVVTLSSLNNFLSGIKESFAEKSEKNDDRSESFYRKHRRNQYEKNKDLDFEKIEELSEQVESSEGEERTILMSHIVRFLYDIREDKFFGSIEKKIIQRFLNVLNELATTHNFNTGDVAEYRGGGTYRGYLFDITQATVSDSYSLHSEIDPLNKVKCKDMDRFNSYDHTFPTSLLKFVASSDNWEQVREQREQMLITLQGEYKKYLEVLVTGIASNDLSRYCQEGKLQDFARLVNGLQRTAENIETDSKTDYNPDGFLDFKDFGITKAFKGLKKENIKAILTPEGIEAWNKIIEEVIAIPKEIVLKTEIDSETISSHIEQVENANEAVETTTKQRTDLYLDDVVIIVESLGDKKGEVFDRTGVVTGVTPNNERIYKKEKSLMIERGEAITISDLIRKVEGENSSLLANEIIEGNFETNRALVDSLIDKLEKNQVPESILSSESVSEISNISGEIIGREIIVDSIKEVEQVLRFLYTPDDIPAKDVQEEYSYTESIIENVVYALETERDFQQSFQYDCPSKFYKTYLSIESRNGKYYMSCNGEFNSDNNKKASEEFGKDLAVGSLSFDLTMESVGEEDGKEWYIIGPDDLINKFGIPKETVEIIFQRIGDSNYGYSEFNITLDNEINSRGKFTVNKPNDNTIVAKNGKLYIGFKKPSKSMFDNEEDSKENPLVNLNFELGWGSYTEEEKQKAYNKLLENIG